MYVLKTTHFIARATKYALCYHTLIKAYASLLNPKSGDFKEVLVNIGFIIIITIIQETFESLINDRLLAEKDK